MSFLKRRSTRLYVGMFLILTLALWSLPTTALADSGTATVSLNAGSLTETGDFSQAKVSATLTGFDLGQGVAYNLSTQVIDATGSGAGWNLQISGTPLSDGVNGHKALLQVAIGPTTSASCAQGSTCTLPISQNIGPTPIVGAPNKYYAAIPNSGMGAINVQTLILVFVPGNTFAGTYTSTLTLAVVSGP